MLDNLRRTLSAPAAFLTLIAGWTLPFASPVIWTAFVLACIAIPPLLPVVTGVIPHRRGISKRSHLRAVGTDLVLAACARRTHGDIPCPPGMVDDRRHRADTLTRLCDTAKASRVGDGSASEVRFRPHALAASITA